MKEIKIYQTNSDLFKTSDGDLYKIKRHNQFIEWQKNINGEFVDLSKEDNLNIKAFSKCELCGQWYSTYDGGSPFPSDDLETVWHGIEMKKGDNYINPDCPDICDICLSSTTNIDLGKYFVEKYNATYVQIADIPVVDMYYVFLFLEKHESLKKYLYDCFKIEGSINNLIEVFFQKKYVDLYRLSKNNKELSELLTKYSDRSLA